MKFSALSFFLISLIFFSCKQRTSFDTEGAFKRGEPISELTNKRLKEISGLAASIENPGMFWVHNDRGNDPEIYLINTDLDIKLTVTLAGVENRDWEDITIGPGPDSIKNYVYIGDIGDNDAAYPYKYIYRFPEPTLASSNQISISDFDTIVFRLEDGVKDTESLFIDPRSRSFYLISKREEPVWVYELEYPQIKGDTIIALKKLSLSFKEIVAADCFSATGDILIKNYEHIYYWANRNNEDVITLLGRTPSEVPYEKEPQGEAITWATDGSGFYTLSETKKKQPSYLYFYSKEAKF